VAVYYHQSDFTGGTNCTVSRGLENYGAGNYALSSDGQPGTLGFFDTSVSNLHLQVYDTFRIDAGESTNYAQVTLESGGDLELCTNASLRVATNLVIGSNSVVMLNQGSQLDIQGSFQVQQGGSLIISDGASLHWSGSMAFESGSALKLTSGSSLWLTNAGALVGVSILVDGNSVLHTRGTTEFRSCNLTFNGASQLDVEQGLMLNSTTMRLDGGSLWNIPGTCQVHNGSQLTIVATSLLGVANQTLIVSSNSVIWCEGANRSNKVNGVWTGVGVTIAADNVIVDASSRITADGLGYVAKGDGCGPGGGGYGGNGGAGGAYGGAGGYGFSWRSESLNYGSATLPLDLGSAGGGYGGNGGGAIRLQVVGTLTLDGQITANGQQTGSYSSRWGGGAGGSILVETRNLTGSGKFAANGAIGCQQSGGGGGGRVAVYYQQSDFTGGTNCTVSRGLENYGAGDYGGSSDGRPGTLGFFDTSVWNYNLHVYDRFSFEPGDDFCPASITVTPNAELVLANGEQWSLIDRLVLMPNARVAVEAGSRLTTAGIDRLENITLSVRNGGALDIVGDVVLTAGAHILVPDASTVDVSGLLRVAAGAEITFGSGSTLLVSGGGSFWMKWLTPGSPAACFLRKPDIYGAPARHVAKLAGILVGQRETPSTSRRWATAPSMVADFQPMLSCSKS